MLVSIAVVSCAVPVWSPAVWQQFGAVPLASVQKAEAAGPNVAGATIRKNICTHCSVGCTVLAEVSNGVWIGQEPGWDSPINRGSHCAKGAATRELVHGDRRLRYPMKLVDGQWTRISWDTAINEIGDKMNEIRKKSGAESVYWLGSAKFTNEGAYLNRKFAAYWGTNKIRITKRAYATRPPSRV